MAAFVAQSHVKEAIELALNRQVSREPKVVIEPGQSCARDTLNTCVSLLRIPSLQIAAVQVEVTLVSADHEARGGRWAKA